MACIIMMLYNTFYIANNPIHQYNVFVLASFIQAGESSQGNDHPYCLFLILYRLTGLAIGITFLQWQVISLWKISHV